MDWSKIREYAMGNKNQDNYIEVNWEVKRVIPKVVKNIWGRYNKNRLMIRRFLQHGKH